ncbi:MAG: hypothetical protein H6837_15090 [Planctomycetes bacterium]|nr:hypothetical protein [Planctomycetota bacterium]
MRRLVQEGTVEINGSADRVVLQRRLRSGDTIRLTGVPPEEWPTHASRSGAPLTEVYRDADHLVVDKAAGIATGAARGDRAGGLLAAIRESGDDPELRIVNRLDPGASGLVLLACGAARTAALTERLGSATLRVEMLALVHGVTRWRETRVDCALGPDPRSRGLVRVVDPESKGARPAITELVVEDVFRSHTLLRIVPLTWRGHQVRAHLRHLGHPVVGDRDYGGSERLLLSEFKPGYKARPGVVERPLLQRMFLHAARIRWEDAGGVLRDHASPPPEELSHTLAKLRSFAPAPRRG